MKQNKIIAKSKMDPSNINSTIQVKINIIYKYLALGTQVKFK